MAENSFENLRKKSSESERHRARHRAGGKVHDDAAADKKLIGKEFKKLEAKEDKVGERVAGKSGAKRLDRGGRVAAFKRGGHVKGKSGSKTKVNVVVMPQGGGGHPPSMPPPMMGKPGMPPPGAGGPPPGMPPGMPPGGPPMPPPGAPPMGAKRGGRVLHRKNGGKVGKPEAISAKMHGGAGGAEGRLEKAKTYGSRP